MMSACFPSRTGFPAALRRWLIGAAVLIAVLILIPAGLPRAAHAQDDAAAFAARIAAWQSVIDHSGTVLSRGNLAESDYEAQRVALSEVFDQAHAAADAAAETVATTRQMIEALGTAPAAGQPEEAAPVAAERERLAGALVQAEGRVHQAGLLATRADILLRTANERRIAQFAETLFQRGVAPLAPATWEQLPVQVQFLRDRFDRALASAGQAGISWRIRLLELAGLALVLLGPGWLVRRRLLGRFGHRAVAALPSYRERVTAAAVEAFARGLLPAALTLAAAVVLLASLEGVPFVGILRNILKAAAGGLVFLFFCSGLGRAVLSPAHPAWRLARLDEASVRPLARRVRLFAAALALAGAVVGFLETALVAPELHAVAGFAAKLLGAAALLALLPGRLWRRPPAPEAGGAAPAGADGAAADLAPLPRAAGPRHAWPRLRLLFAGAAGSVVVLSALRYHNFSLHVAVMLLAGTAAAGLLLPLRGVGRELILVFRNQAAGRLARLRQTLFPGERSLKVFEYVAGVTLDLLLLLLGLVLLLPLSGIEWSELRGWGTTFLRGVTIGEITIAPADILSALVLVVVIMAVTRFVQRKLDERVLQRLQLDLGVQHSIRTGVGYFGVLVALLVGVGTLGLNLSNLALIAGALSVGIGFGLQTVVSNFVAGLILLIERPIKVGDWVVIGDKEGTVKRISVRATEIQTFQRASVIIPNAELVSKAVVNWTFKDKYGRIDIPVGVSYECDVEQVRRVLLACAEADRRVTRIPPPRVVFRDFGDSALKLELRCFVADVDVYLTVATDLRFAIFKAFREHKIEMPYAQQVVHIPQLDRLPGLPEIATPPRAPAGTR